MAPRRSRGLDAHPLQARVLQARLVGQVQSQQHHLRVAALMAWNLTGGLTIPRQLFCRLVVYWIRHGLYGSVCFQRTPHTRQQPLPAGRGTVADILAS